MGKTTNFNLQTYEASEAPNLLGAYNTSIGLIDTAMQANKTAASSAASAASSAASAASSAASTAATAKSTAESANATANANKAAIAKLQTSAFSPQPTDKPVTVEQLGKAKITQNGIIYFTA